MKHGDTIKLHINNSFIEAIFHGWESSDMICYMKEKVAFLTHWESVVEINGELI